MLRLIGDLHGKSHLYLDFIKDVDYSIQIGDFGFDYSVLDKVDHRKHIVLPGNHDNYDIIPHYPHFLPSYGYCTHGGLVFFYVRGAFSIDWRIRVLKHTAGEWPKTWWAEQEELNHNELMEAIQLYQSVKPDCVISHDCPLSISKRFSNAEMLKNFGYDPKTFRTMTQVAFDVMFEGHKPKQWFFGHYHTSWSKNIDGTLFRCIDQETYFDVKA